MSFRHSKQLGLVPPDVKGAVVLVVDDERAWRIVLETELSLLGYTPLLAADSIDALNQCFQLEPDVAIIDLMLPGSDGLCVLSELSVDGTSIPTIFYSAYPMTRVDNQLLWAWLHAAQRLYSGRAL